MADNLDTSLRVVAVQLVENLVVYLTRQPRPMRKQNCRCPYGKERCASQTRHLRGPMCARPCCYPNRSQASVVVDTSRAGFGRTSLLEMGTESWTMLPISLTLALSSFSFSAAWASSSFFCVSMSAGTYQRPEQSKIESSPPTFLLQEIGDILLGLHRLGQNPGFDETSDRRMPSSWGQSASEPR